MGRPAGTWWPGGRTRQEPAAGPPPLLPPPPPPLLLPLLLLPLLLPAAPPPLLLLLALAPRSSTWSRHASTLAAASRLAAYEPGAMNVDCGRGGACSGWSRAG